MNVQEYYKQMQTLAKASTAAYNEDPDAYEAGGVEDWVTKERKLNDELLDTVTAADGYQAVEYAYEPTHRTWTILRPIQEADRGKTDDEGRPVRRYFNADVLPAVRHHRDKRRNHDAIERPRFMYYDEAVDLCASLNHGRRLRIAQDRTEEYWASPEGQARAAILREPTRRQDESKTTSTD